MKSEPEKPIQNLKHLPKGIDSEISGLRIYYEWIEKRLGDDEERSVTKRITKSYEKELKEIVSRVRELKKLMVDLLEEIRL